MDLIKVENLPEELRELNKIYSLRQMERDSGVSRHTIARCIDENTPSMPKAHDVLISLLSYVNHEKGVTYPPDAVIDPLCIANEHFKRMEWKSASTYFIEVISIIQDHFLYKNVLCDLAKCYLSLKKFSDAQLIITQLQDDPDAIIQAEVSLMQGRYCKMMGNWKEANKYFNQAVVLSDKTSTKLNALIGQIEIAFYQGEIDKFRALATRMLALSLSEKNSNWVNVIFRIYGNLELYHGNLKGARNHYEKAQDVANKTRNQHSRALNCLRLAEVSLREGKLDEAEQLLEEGINIAEMEDYFSIISHAKSLQGWYCLLQEDHERALILAREGLELGKENTSQKLTESYYILSLVLDSMGQSDEAQQVARVGHEHATSSHHLIKLPLFDTILNGNPNLRGDS